MPLDPRSATYRRKLYRRHLWIALIPFGFFVVLGAAAILLSQNIVLGELSSLKARNLRQVADNLELWFAEADSIALGLSTDPELARGAEYILKTGIPSHEDLKLSKSLQSLLASSVNSRLYLHSVTVATDSSAGLILTSNEGLVRADRYADADWTAGSGVHAEEISPWIRARSYHPLPNFPLSLPLLSFYRNMLGTGSLEKRGVIAVNVDVRRLDGLLEKEAGGAGGGYLVVDRPSGQPIAGMKLDSPAVDHLLDAWAGAQSGAAAVGDARAGDADPGEVPPAKGLARLRIGGEDYAMASLASERFPFVYFFLSPAEELTRIPRRVLWTGGLFAALSLAVGGLLAAAPSRGATSGSWMAYWTWWMRPARGKPFPPSRVRATKPSIM